MMGPVQSSIDKVRQGVTLTEVLMSLMIMSIGVTSVMTLFPIATLRSAQATRLTNSALLKYNVEALLEAKPQLIFDPDGDGNLVEHFRSQDRNYIVDPLGYMSAFEYGGATSADRLGGTLRRYHGGVVPPAFDLTTANAEQVRALRIQAAKESQLGDTWDTQFDFFVENPTTDLIRDANSEVVAIRIPEDIIPDAESLSLISTSATEIPATAPPIVDPEIHRITLFSADGQISQSYPLLAVTGARQATWSESVIGPAADPNRDGFPGEHRPIPREFGGQVGRVLIQSKRTTDFTWLLTVRRSADGQARNVDVVVRFGDRLKLEDEYPYPFVVSPGVNGAGTGTAVCQFPVGAPEPALKRGGYLLDVVNCLWYRIREYDFDSSATSFNVTLEKPASKPLTGAAIFLPGIIDVYPMGSRNLP